MPVNEIKPLTKVRAIAVLAVAAATACSTTPVVRNQEMPYPPTDPKTIAIFDRAAPDWPFIILARIRLDAAWTSSGWKSSGQDSGEAFVLTDKSGSPDWAATRETFLKTKKAAAQIGGEAVIVTPKDVDTSSYNQASPNTGEEINKFFYQRRDPEVFGHSYFVGKTLFGYVIRHKSGT